MSAGAAEVADSHGAGGIVHVGDHGLHGRLEAADLLNACLGDGFVREPDLAAIFASGNGTIIRTQH